MNEKLTENSNGGVLFDRNSPGDYEITKKIRLEQDRCLFSAIRLAVNDDSIDENLKYITRQISRINKFRLEPFTLAAPCRVPDFDVDADASNASPKIGYKGEELASTLYYLANTESPVMETIKGHIQKLVPEFEDFDFHTVGTDRIAFAIRYSDQRETVPSVRLSSGMLTFIGLIALVSTPNRPPLVMIEEPENGLTPQAIKVLYDAIRSLAVNENDDYRSQVLVSSHSPFVICDAWNGDDRDFIHQVRIDDGKSRVMKFSDVVDAQGIQLSKVDGERKHLSLKNAEQVMSGYMAM